MKKNKMTIILFIIVLIIILIITSITILLSNNENIEKEITPSKIDNVTPDDIHELYDDIAYVTCADGALYFNIDDMNKQISVKDLDKKALTGYLFSNLSNRGYLNNDTFDKSIIKKISKDIFSKNIDLTNYINGYVYGYNTYYISKNKVTRKLLDDCDVEKHYVSSLISYSNDEYTLNMDVNFGYVKDGILYDLNDNKLGKYDIYSLDATSILNNMLLNSPYYRYEYIKHDGKYKLDNIAINTKEYIDQTE